MKKTITKTDINKMVTESVNKALKENVSNLDSYEKYLNNIFKVENIETVQDYEDLLSAIESLKMDAKSTLGLIKRQKRF